MNGDTNCAGLIRDRSRNCLSNPPRSVRGKLVSASIFKFINRLHQADIAFLNKVQELKPTIGVFFRNGDDEAEVCLNHFLFRTTRPGFTHTHSAINFFNLTRLKAHFILNNGNAFLQSDDVFAVVGKSLVDVCFFGRAINPVEVALGTLEALYELLTVHTALSDHQSHDFTL